MSEDGQTSNGPKEQSQATSDADIDGGDSLPRYNLAKIIDDIKGTQPGIRNTFGVGCEYFVYSVFSVLFALLTVDILEAITLELSSTMLLGITVKNVIQFGFFSIYATGFSKERPVNVA